MIAGEELRMHGRISVDAKHAILKLREHRLADPQAYLVELARAASAAGAKVIEVDVKSRSLELSHDGHAPSIEQLGRLVQYIFDAGPEELHLRLLALAVNGSLALEPARISVEIALERGSAVVEIDADRIDGSGGTLPVRTTDRALGTGVRVRFAWPLIGRRPGPELELLEDAARDAPVDVVIGGRKVSSRAPSLRTSFDAGTERAFVELSASSTAAQIVFLEHGFRLVTVPWRLGALSELQRVVGLRAVVDARELPTNVSRSKLQNGEELEDRVTVAANAAVARLIGSWANELTDGARDPTLDNRLSGDDARRLLEAGIAALLGSSARDEPAFARLPELPLLRDATGAPRRIADFMGLQEILATRTPQPAELGWLAERVLLLEDRPIERLFSERRVVDADDILERGRAGLERRKRHLAHPETGLELFGEEYVARGSIADTEGPFAGLRAVFGVRAESAAASGLRCAVHVEGRVLTTLTFGEVEFPLAMDLAMAWPRRLLPSIDYDAIEMTHDVGEAIGRVASEALRRLDEQAPAELLRRALALSVELQGVATATPLVVAESVKSARLWQTANRRRDVSLAELEAYAAETGALCVADDGTTAPDDRPLLRAGRKETRWLERLVRPRHGLVAYPMMTADRDARVRAAAIAAHDGGPPGAPGTPVAVGDGCVAYACVAGRGRIAWLHQSVEVVRVDAPGFHLAVAIDDPALVPSPDWATVLHHRRLSPADVEMPLLDALLDALEDRENAAAFPSPSSDAGSLVRLFLFDQTRMLEREERLARATLIRREQALGRASIRQRKMAQLRVDSARAELTRIRELARRLAAAPIFHVDDQGGGLVRTSLSALLARVSVEPVLVRLHAQSDLARPGTVVAWTADEIEVLQQRWRFVREAPAEPHTEALPVHAPRGPDRPAAAPAAPPERAAFARAVVDAPADCLASRVIDGERFGIGGVLRGRVWIDRQWQPAPAILFHHGTNSTPRTLRIASVGPLDPIVPLCGEIEVVAGGIDELGLAAELHWMQLGARMMRVAAELASVRDDELLSWRPYVWHLALLEQIVAPRLRVTTLDGRRVGVKAVRVQLQTHRRLWFGRDPSQLPHARRELCLLDTPSPLLAILDAGPYANLVRRIGVDGSFGASAEAWLQRTVSSLWHGRTDAPRADFGVLCSAIEAALEELRLAGDPVEHVVAADTGRPVRYRALTRQLVVNTASPLIELVLAEPGNAAHLDALVAAAVSEINRALSGVTDGEERRALLTQLYAFPDERQ